jgi:hypothetical protein
MRNPRYPWKWKWNAITVFQLTYLVCFLASIILIPICSSQPLWVSRVLQEGNPKEFREKRNVFSDVSEIAVESDYLYVLYGEAGVIEVYTLDGDYQKSYAFYTRRSGKAQLHRNNEGVWLEGKDNTLYQFQNGTFVKKLEGLDALNETDLRDGPVEITTENGDYYRQTFVMPSVVRESADGKKTVILRWPFYDFFAQKLSLYFLPVFFTVPFFVMLGNKSQRKREEKKTSWRKYKEFEDWGHTSD